MDSSSHTDFVDYYQLLGVKPTASLNEIRRSYLQLAKEHHPDAGGSISKMQQLNKAYRTLTSSTEKAAYDLLHSFHHGMTTPGDYQYGEGRTVSNISDLKDNEIDDFLDTLLAEYKGDQQLRKRGLKEWLKRYF